MRRRSSPIDILSIRCYIGIVVLYVTSIGVDVEMRTLVDEAWNQNAKLNLMASKITTLVCYITYIQN